MALEARSINLSIDDFLHICRLCGKENNQLSSLYQQITNEKILIEAVKEYFGVNAHIGDGLPEKVCNLCISKINDFLDFIRNCLQTQEMLQKILNGSSSNKTNEENSVSRLGNDKSSEFIDIGLSYIKTEIKTETYDDFTVSDPSNEVNELKPESNPLESTCDPAEHSAPANSSSPNNDGYLVTLEHSAPANSSSTNTEAPVREKRKRVTRLENLNDGYLAQADDPTKPEKIKPTPPTKKLKASQKDLGEETISIIQDMPKYKCPYCDKVCSLESSINIHKRIKHKEEVKNEPKPPKPPKRSKAPKPEIPCSHCSEVFHSTAALTKHIVVHGFRPFPCRHCEKAFKNNGARTVHERIHTGERPFVCDICFSAFYESGNLRKHYTKVHKLEYPRMGWYRDDECESHFDFTKLENTSWN